MNTLSQLEKAIGYHFANQRLLLLAITHSSYAHEHEEAQTVEGLVGRHNERLEFLGDAVLELVSSDFLYHGHEQYPEGELTKLRASLVCEPALAASAQEIGLGGYLRLGRGEEATGGRTRPSITSDAFEAVIGAIYLDGGLEAARAFILRFVLNDIENKRLFSDSKTHLQELAMKRFNKEVTYALLDETGPEHCKQFTMQAMIGEEPWAIGVGNSKKGAQQLAAYHTILMLKEKADTCI